MSDNAAGTIIAQARQLITVLANDLEQMTVYDRYLHNKHDPPYMPENADQEYQLLAERCTMNWMPLLVDTPTQAMYVDGYHPGDTTTDPAVHNAAWDHWQRSRLDARQSAIYRGAFAYGHSFTVTERNPKTGKSETRGLSALKTSALYEDPANDIEPVVALHVLRWPEESANARQVKPGEALFWNDTNKFLIYFDNLNEGEIKVGFKLIGAHGATSCPVTRFAATVDLEGRTIGIIGPMKLLNDRINQTVFDLLIAQTGGSFNVRWATGMAPPLKKRIKWLYDEEGNIVRDEDGYPQIEDIVDQLDQNGRPIPEDINLNAKRFLFAEDPDVKFGAIQGTPLEGYIAAVELAVKELAALSQTPPHHMLGQIANLSAEALEAAETSLSRKIQLFKTVFGECWERVFNLAAELDGNLAGAADYSGEVQWRDVDDQGMAKAADALLKLKELEIPKRGLWRRIPGVTNTELVEWEILSEEDPTQIIATGMKNADRVRSEQADTETSQSQMGDSDLVE